MAERDIRRALKKRVEAYGGEIRAVSWIGRRNAPDVLALFRPKLIALGGDASFINVRAAHPFIETKAPGGKPTMAQQREHKRMQDAGCIVFVISTLEQLDDWLPLL